MFALNQGEVCTCPSRALVQRRFYDSFMEAALERTRALRMGNPLDTDTMVGAQAFRDQYEKILAYVDLGLQEGARVLTGGGPAEMSGELADGFYVQPTIFEGDNAMRIFQEEIFGPVVSVTSFDGMDDALKIANGHPLRPRCRRVDAHHEHRLCHGPRYLGERDVHLGDVHGEPFYIGGSQYALWCHTHLVLDVVPGRGSGFSLEAPEGVRFIVRSQVTGDPNRT